MLCGPPGYITPEFYKWPGFLLPAAGFKYEDIRSSTEIKLGRVAPGRHGLGFTKDGNLDNLMRRCATESKHGRVARRATMGYITLELYKRPGFLLPAAGTLMQHWSDVHDTGVTWHACQARVHKQVQV